MPAVIGTIGLGMKNAVLLSLALVVPAAAPASAAGLDGTLVVLNKAEASVSLLELPSGKVRATLTVGDGPHEAATSPDGRLVVVTNYGVRGAPGSSLSVLDLEAGTVVRTVDLGEHTRPHGLQWLPDGRRLVVTAEGSRSLLIVDPVAGRVEKAVGTEQDVSHMVALALGGRRAFVANIGSGSVTVIDLEEGRVVRQIPTGKGSEGLAVSPDGHEVWVTNRADDTVTVLDASSLETRATIECPSFPIRAAFTPDGRHVLVSNANSGDVAVIDAAARKVVTRFAADLEALDTSGRLFGDRFGASPVPVGILVHPSGATAWVAHTNADVVAEVDLDSWQPRRLLTAGTEPDGLAWSPLAAPD
jgi:YVTN family beta-propeller protein